MDTYQIKDYCVEHKKIGAGAFSTIHKAHHIDTNRVYAIKKIDIYKTKKTNKEAYKREFSLLRKIEHKNIIKLHDIIIDSHQQNLFLVLDYYKNGDLAKFLNGRSLKEKYCKKYMFQLRDGLEYLFSKNIIHRDLKPQNLLLDDNYNLIITDFGLAKSYQSNELLETICGSPLFMAPEIIQKKPYSIKSDLWSVGVILYQMLYAKLPYFSKNIIKLIAEINRKPVLFESPFIVSDECIQLMKELLKKDPSDRIGWHDFFNHSWFSRDELMDEQNDLMEISISNFSMAAKNIKNESQFNSFIYKSIQKPSKQIDFEEEEIFDLNMNNSDDKQEEEEDEEEDEEENLFMSCSDIELKPDELSRTVSLPINIGNKYVIVNRNIPLPYSSSPKNRKSLSESFREYLSHSIEFVKNSYEYLSQS
jgi:serine/threonine protein kinase